MGDARLHFQFISCHAAAMGGKTSTTIKPIRAKLAWFLIGLAGIERVVGWGGSIDFLLSRWKEPGWVGDVLAGISKHANALGFAALIVGIVLLIRSERRRNDDLYAGGARTVADPDGFKADLQVALDSGGITIDGGSFDDEEANEPSLLYVGRAVLNARQLQRDHEIELALVCFNATDKTLKLARVAGRTFVGFRTEDNSGEGLNLGAPAEIVDRTPVDKAPFAEFMLVLRWQLRPSEADEVISALQRGLVSFDLREIRIDMADATDATTTVSLPLPGGVTMRTADAGELMYNTMIYGEVKAAVSG